MRRIFCIRRPEPDTRHSIGTPVTVVCDNPIGDLTSLQFGYSTATLASSLGSGGPNGGLNPLYQVGGPRSIQFGLKLQF